MNKTLTFQDLLAFALNETELPLTVQVTRAIEEDENTHASFENIKETLEAVSNSLESPSEKSIAAILSAA